MNISHSPNLTLDNFLEITIDTESNSKLKKSSRVKHSIRTNKEVSQRDGLTKNLWFFVSPVLIEDYYKNVK